MQRVVVYCGANVGNVSSFQTQAKLLGRALARRDIELVYGGASVGLMGLLADAVLEAGGRVTGVFPHWITKWEVPHQGLTQLHMVDSMHERKTIMADLADAAIALPGGLGTIEEVFEMLTWQQMGLHSKPVVFLDTDDFFQHLFHFLDEAVTTGMLKDVNRERAVRETDVEAALDFLTSSVNSSCTANLDTLSPDLDSISHAAGRRVSK